MIKSFIFTLFLVSCASSRDSNWTRIQNNDQVQKKLIPVSSREEAKKVINNKVNFLKMLFEQSVDPYFGTPRWSDQCLKLNQIGPVTEINKGIQSTSFLILNPNGEPGFCKDQLDQNQYLVTYLYCDGKNDVMEFKFSYSKDFILDQEKLCD